ncbi:MAG: hypothetical protein P1Q69_02160 [Candidatus Thorarchaeota archaeon]|nr:hypothetical protein [Candidatus Thorarchaeota archaeon]
MNLDLLMALVMQLPYDMGPLPEWLDAMEWVLNMVYAFAVNGFLILILLGFIIYTTGLSDSFSKLLVIGGVALYFVGPTLANFLANSAGLGLLSIESAQSTWYALFGIYETQMVALMVTIGDIVVAICILLGAILYFTPSSGDLKSRGYSLIVRALIFAPILAFLQVAPWI